MDDKNKYGLDELFFLAMEIESDGEEFYRRMAGRTHDTKRKEIFNHLAEQEKEHSDTFMKFYGTCRQGLCDFTVNFLEKVPRISAVASERIFKENEMSKMFENARDENELIDLAIKCECDTIDLYKELQQDANEGLGLILERLISEEDGHKKELEELKSIEKKFEIR